MSVTPTEQRAESDAARLRLLSLPKDEREAVVASIAGGRGDPSAGGDAAAWPKPASIESSLAPVPSMVPEMIPELLRAWLVDVADRASLPLEYPTVAAITAVGGLVGRRLTIKPKPFDDWLVCPNTWGAVVGKPGSMKSPALKKGLAPLYRLAAAAVERHRDATKRHNAVLMASEAEVKARKAELDKLAKQGAHRVELERAAADVVALVDDATAPAERVYVTNDPTVERLGELLATNEYGLMVFRDELTGWFKMLGKDGHENDRGFYLEAWDGLGSFYRYDRIGRGTTIIPNPTLTVFGGIQPGPLARHVRDSGVGDGGDGLIQRFQLLVYPDMPPYRRLDRPPNDAARDRAFAVFEALDAMNGGDDGDTLRVCYAADAQPVFDDWFDALENRIREGSDGATFLLHLGKYRRLVPALSLVFHLVDRAHAIGIGEPAGPVPREAVELAIRWCDFLEAHARRVYLSAADGDVHAATVLADRLKAGAMPNPFTPREVANKGWSGLRDVAAVELAVGVLEDRGWVRVTNTTSGPTGGRPSRQIWINPNVAAGPRGEP